MEEEMEVVAKEKTTPQEEEKGIERVRKGEKLKGATTHSGREVCGWRNAWSVRRVRPTNPTVHLRARVMSLVRRS